MRKRILIALAAALLLAGVPAVAATGVVASIGTFFCISDPAICCP